MPESALCYTRCPLILGRSLAGAASWREKGRSSELLYGRSWRMQAVLVESGACSSPLTRSMEKPAVIKPQIFLEVSMETCRCWGRQ